MMTDEKTFLQIGNVVATASLISALEDRFPTGGILMLALLVKRHQACDWGDTSEEDKRSNDYALRNDEHIVSWYKLDDDFSVMIVTEWDRSVTTLMLPEDY